MNLVGCFGGFSCFWFEGLTSHIDFYLEHKKKLNLVVYFGGFSCFKFEGLMSHVDFVSTV